MIGAIKNFLTYWKAYSRFQLKANEIAFNSKTKIFLQTEKLKVQMDFENPPEIVHDFEFCSNNFENRTSP